MSIQNVAFKTRARTIDHLGREQIADCPTAVSELWKNSYDAYAREVALHIFDGESSIAAVMDDGHGMSRDEFIEKWLVVGTESKATLEVANDEDRDGLPYRPKQGQKGIGRLSSAALGPLLLLVSKRKTTSFMAALIDWRLFENPFLYLQDIEIPVVDFDNQSDLFSLLPSMFDKLMGNVWGDPKEKERTERILAAWARYDAQEQADMRPCTREAIEKVIIGTTFTERHIEQWPVWSAKSFKGTAMVVADIAFDLQAQLSSHSRLGEGQQIAIHARERLVQTLSNFTDPFVDEKEEFSEFGASYFKYSVTAWEGDLSQTIISDIRQFDYRNLEDLEHVVDGEIDSSGIFRGKIKAFGKWLEGEVTITPSEATPARADTKVGPFRLRLGTLEQLLSNTTHTQEVHAKYMEYVEKFAGFRLYRNGLRVMPYGREDNDFFDIEKRRTNNAGREFWSYRRLFGRVALTREANPNLRDKAGREGIIENKATKAFRDIVINILKETARRYFGSDSEIRSQIIPEINANWEKQKAEEADKKIRTRKRKEFRNNLTKNAPLLTLILDELELMANQARSQQLPESVQELLNLKDRISDLKVRRSELSLGRAPKSLGTLDAEYKRFRNNETRANQLITQLADSIYLALEKYKPKSPRDLAYAEINKNGAYLHHRLRKWSQDAKNILADEMKRIVELTEHRNKLYHEITLPILGDIENNRVSFSKALEELEKKREILDQENSDLFTPYISTLKSLQDSVDVESLVTFSMDEASNLKQEIERLNGLAQLGITVEIIGHEVEGLETTVTRGLKEMPEEIKTSKAYQAAKTAHESLAERLRFLSPLKLSGEKIQLWVEGQKILDYVQGFFGDSLAEKGITLEGTAAFRQFSVYEQPARLYPVFVNLINNAAYWVCQSPSSNKQISLDVSDGKVIISDDGPGVEQDDIAHLFSLFFTRKIRGGRGVGLYLCRANLAAGGHIISYLSEPKLKKLPGANFAIEFKGAKNV